MVVDFQHHYTPPELMETGKGDGTLRLDENGNPNYRFNATARRSICACSNDGQGGIDVAVLSCGSGFDQPNLATCSLINDRMHQAEHDHPGRFIGLAHGPALNSREARAELKRCAIELWRMLGWEFSLMVATVRLINSGLLDELPSLKIQVSHFGGGIARYLPRGLQDREKSGTAKIPRHSRRLVRPRLCRQARRRMVACRPNGVRI
jgi:hypothetical protein